MKEAGLVKKFGALFSSNGRLEMVFLLFLHDCVCLFVYLLFAGSLYCR